MFLTHLYYEKSFHSLESCFLYLQVCSFLNKLQVISGLRYAFANHFLLITFLVSLTTVLLSTIVFVELFAGGALFLVLVCRLLYLLFELLFMEFDILQLGF